MISTYRHLEFIWRNLLWKIGPLLFRAVALVTKGYARCSKRIAHSGAPRVRAPHCQGTFRCIMV